MSSSYSSSDNAGEEEDEEDEEITRERRVASKGLNDVSCFLFSLISPPNRRKIRRNTCPDGIWWLRGARCLAMRALGEQFGVVEGSSGAKMGAQGWPNKKL